MPSTKRRTFLVSLSATLAAVSGCTSPTSEQPAHTVSVYLVDEDDPREVTVAVEAENGDTVFDRTYDLSERNEADEDATFLESTAPETVVVTVDGRRFERDWPGFEQPELPCNGQNWAGIEVWVSNEDGEPSVRIEPNCQHVTVS
ncbi:hypothetical protein LPA44_06895 [Halobacterium sp. KA-4]|uniref:hypothetical protein n=1 Tax=Halobacterium sp. KA-4 TaxID=2896367 RepID=UPI001E5BA497|nr:hypothetical protein [Halobacterium sp. KA-4]MCD2199621.1 hypothetical protein [Halobacterium sp. KA-4]